MLKLKTLNLRLFLLGFPLGILLGVLTGAPTDALAETLDVPVLEAPVQGASGSEAQETEPGIYYRWIDQHGHVQYTDFEPLGTPSQRVELAAPDADSTDTPLRSASNVRPTDFSDSDSFHDQDQQILPIEHIGPCADARQQLAVLYTELPVYRDAGGELRTAWRGDSYRGRRAYLEAEQRQAAIAATRTQLLAVCSDPKAFESEVDAFKDQLR